MLDSLLVCLLPYHASKAEIEFHKSFVLTAYQDFCSHFHATGYKDPERLKQVNQATSYSMSQFGWREYFFVRRINKFKRAARNIKRSVTDLDKVEEVLKTP